MMHEFGYETVYGCGSGSVHRTCFALLVAAERDPCSKGKKEYVAHVLEAPSLELAQAICSHIGVHERERERERERHFCSVYLCSSRFQPISLAKG